MSSDSEDEAAAGQRQLSAGPAGGLREGRVTTLEQELSSLGRNVLQDDLLDLDGVDKDVLAEEQELRAGRQVPLSAPSTRRSPCFSGIRHGRRGPR